MVNQQSFYDWFTECFVRLDSLIKTPCLLVEGPIFFANSQPPLIVKSQVYVYSRFSYTRIVSNNIIFIVLYSSIPIWKSNPFFGWYYSL